ncbi:MAG TPA: YifB family Mg chelatase-like AAA ATPase [Elusimicrobiota bacterium]|nr:YifB family Mg chelatase-like AAA ATPase [Elusimicrobiota bacterium]
MLAELRSAAVNGIDGFLVAVELDLANGLPSFTTVGLPDSCVREARERVVAALRNSGFDFPCRRVTVNLAPGRVRKAGTHFDLPIGLGALVASGQVETAAWSAAYCFIGELALDGSLRPVPGVLPMAAAARRAGLRGIVLPAANAREAGAAGIAVHPVSSLREAAELLRREEAPPPAGRPADEPEAERAGAGDLADVRGQALAKRAVELAAAGGHNLLMIGPPGSGKSMLARRLPDLLPPLDEEEAIEVSKIFSVCGLLPAGAGLLRAAPFRAPHHTATLPSLVGGGARCRPGEVSLAHKGVLFLDELPEFSRRLLEALRQPLEERRVCVVRSRESVEYPADFLLVAAMNPCPCGFLGHRSRPCRCPLASSKAYRARLSGPLLDRLDLRVEVAALEFAQWAAPAPARSAEEGTKAARERVLAARARAKARGGLNARLGPEAVRLHCAMGAGVRGLAEQAARRFALSARALDRLLRVSRTLADMAGEDRIREEHLAEALQFRSLEGPLDISN